LRLGASFSWASGIPRTSMLAHPLYQNSGEIPGINPTYAYWADPGTGAELRKTKTLGTALADPDILPFGGPFLFSYDPVKRGNLGRRPHPAPLHLHGDYPIPPRQPKLPGTLDLLNRPQRQEPPLYDADAELTAGVPHPAFLKPQPARVRAARRCRR